MNRKISLKTSECKKLTFRKFSRKKYAAFNSMHKIVHIGTLVMAYSLIISPFKVFAQNDSITFSKVIDMDEVEIVGQKSPILFEEIPRMVSIIKHSEIESAASISITDLLKYTSNVDIRQRGKGGIQSDISIRGGSFDQTMILLNGINISDPQTGHLSLILPIDIQVDNRIEVLNGPAARVHGANAFSGAINFVTRPSELNSLKISSSYGDYNYYNGSIMMNYNYKRSRNLLYYNYAQSDGYISNTDFKRHNFFYQNLSSLKEGTLDAQFGYSERAFGANGFYTPAYPDQFEKNQMTFVSLGYSTGKKIKNESKVYWRRHHDRFELFREDKNWYRIENGMTISNDTSLTHFKDTISWYSKHNHHINDVFGVTMKLSAKSKIGTSTLGYNLRSENIISTNVGYSNNLQIPVRGFDSTWYTRSDSRTNFDLFAEQTIHCKPVYISAGMLVNWNSYLPDEINVFPGADIRVDITSSLSAILSYNYTLGLPTFTDLHYEDPTNQGNPGLDQYSQHTFEGGLRAINEFSMTTANYFYNYGKNIIEWEWYSEINRYRPINLDEFTANGVEIASTCNFTKLFGQQFIVQSLRLNYTYMDVKKAGGGDNISKYNNVKQSFSSIVLLRVVKKLVLSFNFSYIEREGNYAGFNFQNNQYEYHPYIPYWLVDTKISYNYKWITPFLEVTNLLDKKYSDLGSLIQPGRWIVGGIQIELSGF